MVRPASFGFHAEAAASNPFAAGIGGEATRTEAIREAEGLARRLGDAGVEVLMLEDQPEPEKPDAVFPNNWVSFHLDGTIVLYPMATERRRMERDFDRVQGLLASTGFEVSRIVDLTSHEDGGRFLEGTGSLILDRPRGRAFASRSLRTHDAVVAEFDRKLGYSTVLFDAFGASGQPIYHTNVLLSLGTHFAILCSDVVPDEQLGWLREQLLSDRELIEVNYAQMGQFACNILELRGSSGPAIAMSTTALSCFDQDQRRRLERFGELVAADIPTIERVGGGSVRCMIADVHLPRR